MFTKTVLFSETMLRENFENGHVQTCSEGNQVLTGSNQASDWLRENLFRKLLKCKIRFEQKLQKNG